MNDNKEFPRTLIIYHSCINKADQHGVSIREWFAEWPKEKLAQIYSGGEVGNDRFCGYNFKLGDKERRFGKYFFKLKNSSLGQSSYSIIPDKDFNTTQKLSFKSLLKNRIGNFLINTGFWEIIFHPRLSNNLNDFIVKFNPQIIYCQGYNLTFSWLPLIISKKYKIPICFQTGDDWPVYLYKNSPLSFAIRPIVQNAAKSLISNSAVRFANGKLMANEYQRRYGVTFEPFMMCDAPVRFRNASIIRVVDDETISILYSGNLGQGRWLSLVELCEAAKLLQNESGNKIKVIALATTIPKEAINILRDIDNLRLLPGPSHEELPAYLKGADILFLPETFNPIMAEEIRFSISTKAHFYMMSEKPVIVYASPITGIMDYAKEGGWACTVEEQDMKKLTAALKELLFNSSYRMELINQGIKVVSSNHDGSTVRARFLTVLSQIDMRKKL